MRGGLVALLTLGLVGVADAAPAGFVGTLAARGLDESSGLVKSRAHDGVFWSHNDSGGKAQLFAVGPTGEDRGVVDVTGARAQDWEDIAVDPQGNLWIHDGGNNANKRRDLTVYRIPEPEALSGTVAADRAIRFHYPEQTEFPPAARNFDSEALFWDGGRMYLLTKHRGDTETALYVFPAGFEDAPAPASGGDSTPASLPLERLGSFDVGGDRGNYGGMVTAADLSPDGQHLAILTYHAIFVFSRPPDVASGEGESSGAASSGGEASSESVNWLAGPSRRIGLAQPLTVQCEAIAWDGGALLFTNEGRAVMRIDAPLDAACTSFPSKTCAP